MNDRKDNVLNPDAGDGFIKENTILYYCSHTGHVHARPSVDNKIESENCEENDRQIHLHNTYTLFSYIFYLNIQMTMIYM